MRVGRTGLDARIESGHDGWVGGFAMMGPVARRHARRMARDAALLFEKTDNLNGTPVSSDRRD